MLWLSVIHLFSSFGRLFLPVTVFWLCLCRPSEDVSFVLPWLLFCCSAAIDLFSVWSVAYVKCLLWKFNVSAIGRRQRIPRCSKPSPTNRQSLIAPGVQVEWLAACKPVVIIHPTRGNGYKLVSPVLPLSLSSVDNKMTQKSPQSNANAKEKRNNLIRQTKASSTLSVAFAFFHYFIIIRVSPVVLWYHIISAAKAVNVVKPDGGCDYSVSGYNSVGVLVHRSISIFYSVILHMKKSDAADLIYSQASDRPPAIGFKWLSVVHWLMRVLFKEYN